jgi:hypothetical protein
LDPEYAYVLGASYDVESLETRNREHIVNNFQTFINRTSGKTYFNMLMQWCPEKVFQLIHDAVVGSGNNPLKSAS